MIRIFRARSLHFTAAAVLQFIAFILLQARYTQAVELDLAAQVAALELGMNGYIIGTKLSASQKKSAAANMSQDSYAGTYKFNDGDLYVVATADNDMVLAVYQRNEAADMEQAKRMISGLMGLYGEPTAMAHDKLIYWAYTKEGKIPEETYRRLKENNEIANILATVKFNSSFEITGENTELNEPGINYFIVSSDPLSREFMEHQE